MGTLPAFRRDVPMQFDFIFAAGKATYASRNVSSYTVKAVIDDGLQLIIYYATLHFSTN